MSVAELLLFFGRKPQQITQTFNASTTWVAPAGISLLTSVVGHAAAGTTYTIDGYYDPDVTVYELVKIAQIFDSNGGQIGGAFVVSREAATATTPVPDFYCENERPNGQTWCYAYTKESHTVRGDYHPPTTGTTTGASASGFGQVFPGGIGGAASTLTFTNLSVTPGASYSLVVPSGAAIQITYLQ